MTVISREEQFAEKLHAYTLPREGRPNTRVKDLVDMLLLVDSRALDLIRLKESIQATFRRRATHDAPLSLPSPPPTWADRFGELAAECGLDGDMAAHCRRLDSFLAGIKK